MKLHEMRVIDRLSHGVMPLTLQDMYKSFHVHATKPGLEYAYSNLTPRFGKHSNTELRGVISAGQQYFVLEILYKLFKENFFERPRADVLYEYQYFVGGALFKDIDTTHIGRLYDLGYLPLEVKALPEGTFVPYGIPMLTMQNTVAGFGWLVGALEDEVSAEIWPISTAATTAFNYRLNFEKSQVAKEMIPFMGHNFSYRGMMGHTAAAMVDFGHLTSFMGSDTTPGGILAWRYYGADPSGVFEGRNSEITFTSVNATEHSVMCSYGEQDELEGILHIMENVAPTGILSLVMDAYDFWNVVTNYLPAIKDRIMARDGTLVIRPDSGDPVDIVCGLHPSKVTADTPEHEVKGLIECLWDTFGGTVTPNGYKLLDSHIGAIYGDSITLERQAQIIQRLEAKGFVPSCVLGIGSYTYQHVTRDTHGFAMKCTAVKFAGDREWTPIFKQPKTDSSKTSARGLMMVKSFDDNRKYELVQDVSAVEESRGALHTIFKDGQVWHFTSLTEIRANVANIDRTQVYK